MGCALLAFVLPFLEVPKEWSVREAIVEAPIAKSIQKPIEFVYQKPKEENLSTPIQDQPHKHDQSTNSKNEIAEKEAITAIAINSLGNKMSLSEVLMYIYFAGVIIFALIFLMQLVLLSYKMLTLPTIRDGQFKIVEIDKDKAPFSFWNRIFMNPSKLLCSFLCNSSSGRDLKYS